MQESKAEQKGIRLTRNVEIISLLKSCSLNELACTGIKWNIHEIKKLVFDWWVVNPKFDPFPYLWLLTSKALCPVKLVFCHNLM